MNKNNHDNLKSEQIQAQAKGIKFEKLTFSENGSGLLDKNMVIKNKHDFELAWSQAHQKMKPIPSLPEVDFEKENVIFLDFGQSSSGGRQYNIEKVDMDNDTAIVILEKPKDFGNMMATMAITRPFMFIKINKTNLNNVQVK